MQTQWPVASLNLLHVSSFNLYVFFIAEERISYQRNSLISIGKAITGIELRAADL